MFSADAELFLQNGGNHYTYLETIQEETSDDLQSDSDFSDSRASPAGWLATDSESGSVIRIQTIGNNMTQINCFEKFTVHNIIRQFVH